MADGFRWGNINDYIGSVYRTDSKIRVCGCFYIACDVIMTSYHNLDKFDIYRFEFPASEAVFLSMMSYSPKFNVALFRSTSAVSSHLSLRAVALEGSSYVNVYVPCENGTYTNAKILNPASNNTFHLCHMRNTPKYYGFPVLDERGVVLGVHINTNIGESIVITRMDKWIEECYEPFSPSTKDRIEKMTGYSLLYKMEPFET